MKKNQCLIWLIGHFYCCGVLLLTFTEICGLYEMHIGEGECGNEFLWDIQWENSRPAWTVFVQRQNYWKKVIGELVWML